jgi:hypothetical protein
MKKIVAACLCIALCAAAGCVSLPGAGAPAVKATATSAFPRESTETGVSMSPGQSNGDAEDFSLFTAEPSQEAPTQAVVASATATATPAASQVLTATATASSVSGNREDLTRAELLPFFKDVVFGAAADSVARKWAVPVVVSVTGGYNTQDDEQLTSIFDMLNEYDGFPGVTYLSAAGAGATANLLVKFVTAGELRAAKPNWDGKSTLLASPHKDDKGNIDGSAIYLVSEAVSNQSDRNYLLTWGVFFSIGFFYDSGIYYDSMFDPAHYNDISGGAFTSPVAADWYLVSMLYAPAVKSGMTYEQAAAALGD